MAEEEKARQRRARIRSLLLQGGPLIALLALCLFITLSTPFFLTESNMTNVARRTAIIVILAVGQTFVILSSGIDLSVGSTAALAGSVSTVMMTQPVRIGDWVYGPIDFGVGLIVALATGLLAGLINGLIITKGRIPDFIATLGTLATFQGVALLVTEGLPIPSFSSEPGYLNKLPDPLLWLGGGKIIGLPVPAVIAVLVVVASWFILRYTALGRAIYAVGGNREAARVSGINIDRTRIWVYVISGMLAAIAGFVLVGRLNSANALMGSGQELDSIAAVVIGGTNLFGGEGGAFGSLIGALITGVLQNGLNLLDVSAFWQQIIQGVVITGVVIFDQWRRRRFSQ
ncbi:MAG: ABC transporter permease [Anaerolineae bacterium]|nr:ABC transporter permease [Anaerolineae bacterium]